MFGALLALMLGLNGQSRLALMSAALVAILYVLFLKRIAKAHFYWDANVLALLGLPFFSYLLLRSKAAHAKGKVSWKGRDYGSDLPASQSEQFREPLATSSS